ncbi:MAG: hypothetical protein WCA22_07215 [Candidatus Binatus sp.]
MLPIARHLAAGHDRRDDPAEEEAHARGVAQTRRTGALLGPDRSGQRRFAQLRPEVDDLIAMRWRWVEVVAFALLEQGGLSGREIDAVVRHQ